MNEIQKEVWMGMASCEHSAYIVLILEACEVQSAVVQPVEPAS